MDEITVTIQEEVPEDMPRALVWRVVLSRDCCNVELLGQSTVFAFAEGQARYTLEHDTHRCGGPGTIVGDFSYVKSQDKE